MNKIVLSICIPLHNRSEYLVDHLQELLRVDSDEFDVIISDTSAKGHRLLDIADFHDDRLKVYPAPETVPAMENWYLTLEHADGIFALHLNDRDIIHCENLPAFITFMKEHSQYNGGACKYINGAAPILCDSVEEAVMCVPYFSRHCTGLFFNVDQYKLISNRKEIFTESYSSMYPHDILLGRLSSHGRLIIYTSMLWEMASNDFLGKNRSGMSKNKDLFFEPEQRLKQAKTMLNELQKLDINSALKAKKADQVVSNYLHLATFNYFYYIENDYLSDHYGIPQRHLSIKQKIAVINKTVLTYGRELGFSYRDYIRYGAQIYNRWIQNKIAGVEKRIQSKAFQATRAERALKKQIRSGTILR